MSHLIGLAGYAQTGKDTVGQVFQKHGFTRVGFADALKGELAASLGMSPARLEADKARYREAMVVLGADRRAERPDYWIAHARPRWRACPLAIVTDCRYLNELQAIVADGGQWIWIEREMPDGTTLGPANSEELDSFARIREAYSRGDLAMPASVFRAADAWSLQQRARDWIANHLPAEPGTSKQGGHACEIHHL